MHESPPRPGHAVAIGIIDIITACLAVMYAFVWMMAGFWTSVFGSFLPFGGWFAALGMMLFLFGLLWLLGAALCLAAGTAMLRGTRSAVAMQMTVSALVVALGVLHATGGDLLAILVLGAHIYCIVGTMQPATRAWTERPDVIVVHQ